jgi:NADPH:quinone reductase-like Zn-dependent oxidoreductase
MPKSIVNLLVFVMTASTLSSQPVIKLVNDHLDRYPAMQIQDVYKLLYQGEFGVKHIIDSQGAARHRLSMELHQVQPDTSIPLWEIISPDSSLIRINLSPFKAARNELEKLWEAIWKTANDVQGDTAKFVNHWQVIIQGIEDGRLDFPLQETTQFWHTMEANGFPAVHHSQIYRDTYHPAYRVVKMEYLDQITQ